MERKSSAMSFVVRALALLAVVATMAYFGAPAASALEYIPIITLPHFLIDCPPPGVTGDLISRAFYIPSYPGATLEDVTLWLSSSTAGSYTFQLTARDGSFDGPVLGTSTAAVSLVADSGTTEATTFSFPSVAIDPGTIVAFELDMLGGAGGSQYFRVGQGSYCPVIETESSTPPLSTYRRDGIAIAVTGHSPAPDTLIDCPPSESGGDKYDRGFFVPLYPGVTLKDVDLWFNASPPGDYTLSLTAHDDTFDGPVIGSSTKTASLDSTDRMLTFTFFPPFFNMGYPPVTQGNRVAFVIDKVAGPAGGTPYFGVHTSEVSCPVVETVDTTPPLSTFHRDGIAVAIRGVPPGPPMETLTVSVNGSGKVTSTPAGIDCSTDPSTFSASCSHNFEMGTAVALTQTPIDGSGFTSFFIQWGGNCSGSSGCAVTMDGSRSVSADFGALGTPVFAIPVPSGKNAWTYLPVETPVKQPDPANCKPFSVGDFSTGNLSLQVGLPPFAAVPPASGNVDIYLVLTVNVPGGSAAFVITAGDSIQPLSAGFAPWMQNVGEYADTDAAVFGDIPLSALPSGTYGLYLLVTPTGTLDPNNFYLWNTYFVLP